MQGFIRQLSAFQALLIQEEHLTLRRDIAPITRIERSDHFVRHTQALELLVIDTWFAF